MKTKLLTLMLLVGSSMFAQSRFSIRVGIGTPGYYASPPPAVTYTPPPCPGPDYTWVEGYWYPLGPRYHWHAGYWARPPYVGGYWVAPRYSDNRYYSGYWGRREQHWGRDHDERRERRERDWDGDRDGRGRHRDRR
jgi:WXXGXW repeat (2 copies)